MKKFPRTSLSPKVQAGYDKMLAFTKTKGVSFRDLNLLLDNLTKATGVPLQDISPYVILMQWGVYALLWDIQYNTKIFEGDSAEKVPDFLKGHVRGFPNIVLEHLLAGHILPNPRWIEPPYEGFTYHTQTNEFWAKESQEYILDPEYFHAATNIYHEMYHAFQDATREEGLSKFETERNAEFVGYLAGIKTFHIFSEKDLLEKIPPDEKRSQPLRLFTGGKILEIDFLPPQSSRPLAVHYYLENSPEYLKYQADSEKILKEYAGFAIEWFRRTDTIGKFMTQAMQLYPLEIMSSSSGNSAGTAFATHLLKHANEEIAKLIKKEAGLNTNDPQFLPAWHSLLAKRLDSLQEQAKILGGYDFLDYRDQETRQLFDNYLDLLALKLGALEILTSYDSQIFQQYEEFVRSIISSPIINYSPKFLSDDHNDGVGNPIIKKGALPKTKTEMELFKMLEATTGLSDEEVATVDHLAKFIDKEKIPTAQLEKIYKNIPSNLKEDKNPNKRWQTQLVLQWQAYCVLSILINRKIFDTAVQNKLPTEARKRLDSFQKNTLGLIVKWKIHYPSSVNHIDPENLANVSDIFENCYAAYLNTLSEKTIPVDWEVEIFFLRFIVYRTGKNREEIKKEMLKYLRKKNPETKSLDTTYQNLTDTLGNLVTNGSMDEMTKNEMTKKWKTMEEDYAKFKTRQKLKKQTEDFWEAVAKENKLSKESSTLSWSGVLKKLWDRTAEKIGAKENSPYLKIQYFLLEIISHYTRKWDLLGLPHDFQTTPLQDPEEFFAKHLASSDF